MEKWALIQQIALELGYKEPAVKKWRVRRRVPFHARLAIIARAAGSGIVLSDRDMGSGYQRAPK
jgi:hypothetical protein